MKRFLLPSAAAVLAVLVATSAANAQKRGGILRVFQYDSPANMSIHEEALNSAQNPMIAVFNNLGPSPGGGLDDCFGAKPEAGDPQRELLLSADSGHSHGHD